MSQAVMTRNFMMNSRVLKLSRFGFNGRFVNVPQIRQMSFRAPPRSFPYIKVVPQQEAWVIERFGKFSHVLDPGLNILIPLVEKVGYIHSFKENAISVPEQSAITQDNVTIDIDGVLYLKVVDAEKASYGISDLKFAMTQLAQTTMRSELGKINLDETFRERESLNANIVAAINSASAAWGIECLRYEIRDITPPIKVLESMDRQAEAERNKRAKIMDSEGARQAEINVAQGDRQAAILKAQGEARAIEVRSGAIALGIDTISMAIDKPGGEEAVSLRIAEQYVDAFANLAKKDTTMLLPSNPADSSQMVSQAMSIYKNIRMGKNVPLSDALPTKPRVFAVQQDELINKEATKISSD